MPLPASDLQRALWQVSWQDFERLVAEYYRAEGWDVRHVGTAGRASRFDGGVDLELRRDDELMLVQCKHWRSREVPHNALHELIGVVTTRGASSGIVVISGRFTRAARAAAKQQKRVRLIEGDEACRMLAPWLDVESPAEPPPSLYMPQAKDWDAASARARARARTVPAAPPWPVFVLLLACALVLLRCGVSALVGEAPASRADARPAQQHPSPSAQPRPGVERGPVLPTVKVAPASRAPAATGAAPAQVSPASPSRDPDKAIRVIEATTPEM